MQNRLTDRKLQRSSERASDTKLWDSDVPGFGVRVSEVGQKSFILIARYPGSPNPTRRALGEYPSMSLGEARERAKDWRTLIRKGIDPKAEEGRVRRLELRKQATTFASVADDFIERHVKGQRKAVDTEREIRKELIAHWADRPRRRNLTRGGYCSTPRPLHCPHRSRAYPLIIQLGNQPWHLWPRNFAV